VRFYSKIAYSFREFKQENFYHFYNQYNTLFHGVTPYHYFEMWITSLITLPFSIKAIIALKYVTYPFFISSISFGVLGFIRSNRFLTFLLFLCLSTLPLYMISIFGSGFPVYTDFWMRPNFITYYYILLPLFYFIIEKKWFNLYLTVILGGTVSVIIIPCLFGSTFLLSLFLVYRKVIFRKNFILLNTLLIVACVLNFFLFKLFAPIVNLVINHSFKDIVFQSLGIWKAVLHSITTLFIECSLLILSAFLISKYVVKTNEFKNIFYFIILQVIIGVILFQGLNRLDNSYQFPYFSYSSCGFIVIITILVAIDYFKNNSVKFSVVGILIIFCLYVFNSSYSLKTLSVSLENKNLLQNNVSGNWVQQVRTYLNTNEKLKGGFVLCKADLNDLDPKSRSCVTIQMGSFISYLTDNCNLPNLTCKDTLLSDKNSKNKDSFEKVEKWIEAFPIYTEECNVNEYFKSNKIDYLICSKKLLNFDTSLVTIISDSESKFLFLSKKNH